MTNKKSYSSVSQIIFIVLFTASSIGINYLGDLLAGLIAFPLYLDSVMTIAVTALCGLLCSSFKLNSGRHIGGTLTNLVDKIISAAICYAVYQLILKITKSTFKLNLLPL